jgi:HEAT repeat protein
MTLGECERLASELKSPPVFLADKDREVLGERLHFVAQRIDELREIERDQSVKKWQSAFTEIGPIEALEKEDIEDLLKLHQHPPVTLRSGERAVVGEIVQKLTFRLDSMSIDEILTRIEQLPLEAKRRLREELNELIDVENA